MLGTNARTKAWLEFQKDHPNIAERSPAQIWHAGFDAGWYARLDRERELAEHNKDSVQIGHDPDIFVSVSTSPSGQS